MLRFGSELIFSLCEENEVEVVLLNQGAELSFEEELAADVLEIITVFSALLRLGSGFVRFVKRFTFGTKMPLRMVWQRSCEI